MLGIFLAAKYFDVGSLVVKVKINNTHINNTLIKLDDAINVMTRETMQSLGLTGFRETPTIFQLANR